MSRKKIDRDSRTLSRRDILQVFGVGLAALPVGGLLGRRLFAETESAAAMQSEKLALRFAKYYKPVPVKVKPRVPAYRLPLDPAKVANFKGASAALGITADEPSLKQNGFVVIPGRDNEDIVQPYKDLKQRGVPVFITADTLLHLYHVQFDETLKDIEEREFYPDIVALAKALLSAVDGQALPRDTDDFRAAHQKAVTYLAAGVKALDPSADLPKHA